jgi:nicotinamide-nucleotide amidase
MKIELIIIASEILNGKILDLNTNWLAKFLFKQGFELNTVSVIPDDPQIMKNAFLQAKSRSQLVLTSGGLGPTLDDLTKDILAETFSIPMIEHDHALKVTLDNYSRVKREYDKSKLRYHLFPQGGVAFQNPCGTAPGIGLKIENTFFASLPGVPKEFEEMFESQIFPYVENLFHLKGDFSYLLTVKTKLIPESKIFSDLCPTLWQDLSALGSVSSLPHLMGVDIGVHLKANSLDELEHKKNLALTLIVESKLKESIWHIGHKSLEEVIIEEATQKKLTIATAESCTGGLIAHRLTNISGSSNVYLGGVTSYSNELKKSFIAVNAQTLENFGAVSLETAQEMSQGIFEKTNAHICLATTGIAGPTGGSKEKPVGTVAISVKSQKSHEANFYQFVGDRVKLKERFAQRALFLLLDEIRKF